MSMPSSPEKRRGPTYFKKPQSKNANQAKRKCLFCEKDFKSEWSGNRLCGRCKQLTEFKSSSSLRD